MPDNTALPWTTGCHYEYHYKMINEYWLQSAMLTLTSSFIMSVIAMGSVQSFSTPPSNMSDYQDLRWCAISSSVCHSISSAQHEQSFECMVMVKSQSSTPWNILALIPPWLMSGCPLGMQQDLAKFQPGALCWVCPSLNWEAERRSAKRKRGQKTCIQHYTCTSQMPPLCLGHQNNFMLRGLF